MTEEFYGLVYDLLVTEGEVHYNESDRQSFIHVFKGPTNTTISRAALMTDLDAHLSSQPAAPGVTDYTRGFRDGHNTATNQPATPARTEAETCSHNLFKRCATCDEYERRLARTEAEQRVLDAMGRVRERTLRAAMAEGNLADAFATKLARREAAK